MELEIVREQVEESFAEFRSFCYSILKTKYRWDGVETKRICFEAMEIFIRQTWDSGSCPHCAMGDLAEMMALHDGSVVH